MRASNKSHICFALDIKKSLGNATQKHPRQFANLSEEDHIDPKAERMAHKQKEDEVGQGESGAGEHHARNGQRAPRESED